MASWQMRAVAAYLRLTARPRMATAERAARRIAAPKAEPQRPRRLRERHEVTEVVISGFRCISVRPRRLTRHPGPTAPGAGRAVVYVHGGSYINPITTQHWSFITALADAGCRVEVPLYGRAPHHTVAEAVPFVTAVYERLLRTCPASMIGIAGDSAGGGLALAATQAMRDRLPLPAKLVLIAPWLDVTMSNPAIAEAAGSDPWLSPVGLVEAGRAWLGGRDGRDPWASPLFGSFQGLPPMEAVVGTRDLFRPDVLLLRERCEAAGVPCRVDVVEGAVHVYPLTPTPEGHEAASALVTSLTATA
ncbi:hypothetical protein SRB17_82100 [Streptomyces sp. RB17]|uniref:alpha/beta hydrolase fold domain-containing protein n=1 Tax=Streptomyces sp. RB17 TaxID=2585197 RepID=UPI00130C8EDD|nr:alpha/beta hydrolase fold domain-containing protein [Streptomyces sp. RB17]MQY40179.1 hypothetical protein [Streptomyces sp. RB17]